MGERDGERCQRCGRAYAIVWAAHNDLWNEVVGQEGGMLCPDCFTVECEQRGIYPFFVAFREHIQIAALAELAAVTAERDRLRELAEVARHWLGETLHTPYLPTEVVGLVVQADLALAKLLDSLRPERVA